jgi:hypothetical protein
MNAKDLLTVLLAFGAVMLVLKSKTAAAAPAVVSPAQRQAAASSPLRPILGIPDLSGILASLVNPVTGYPTLMHPADAYAGTWTAEGPFVPSAYDKQIWD